MTKCLFSSGFEDLAKTLTELNMPAFRANQVRDWIFKKFVFSFDEMSNISESDIKKLKEVYSKILPPVEKYLVDKADQTGKALIKLSDGELIEAVAIPGNNTMTFCLSTQVGCPVKCLFCRTGKQGFTRNLSAEEIVLQVMVLVKKTGKKPTNIVYMGMGEPFFNSEELYRSIDILTDPKGLGLATRRITISTSGHAKGILELINRPGEVNLAVSLHVANDDARDKLVPMNKKFPLDVLKKALTEYCSKTGRRVTMEVVLLKNTNDQYNDLMNLINFCEGLIVHVNLVRFNNFKECEFEAASDKNEKEFKKELKKAGIAVTVRSSHGQNILAACGQLSGKTQKD
ncbi:MAG: 23S rRNA (adenine(2503)-C(2))-methyltransferase RlmN [Candidatus Riflebacteria bacterium]|nr:23S rRNA (adenine(2503)-C(2))-methyltransferase RlmN [bacterium]